MTTPTPTRTAKKYRPYLAELKASGTVSVSDEGIFAWLLDRLDGAGVNYSYRRTCRMTDNKMLGSAHITVPAWKAQSDQRLLGEATP